MALGLIFYHFFAKTHFGGFSVFHTKYTVILEDKKFQTQKWWIWEKFRHQKLGVTKGFFKVKVVSKFDFGNFLTKWLQRHLVTLHWMTNFWRGSCQYMYLISKVGSKSQGDFVSKFFSFKLAVCHLFYARAKA